MTDAGEIFKSGALDKLADIIHKLAGPMSEEFGLMLGETVRLYRVKNLVSVTSKTERLLAEANLSVNPVPARMFLPIMEAASLEDDETLQGLWAGLLASASEQSDSLSPSFMETLKQLTPYEARVLEVFYEVDKQVRAAGGEAVDLITLQVFASLSDEAFQSMTETYERLGLVRRDFNLNTDVASDLTSQLIDSIVQQQPINDIGLGGTYHGLRERTIPKLTYTLKFTNYGVHFMQACLGPIKS